MKSSPNGFVRAKQFWHTKVLCPHCRQPMPETRLGIQTTPLKAAIIDMVSNRRATQQEIQNLFTLPSAPAVRKHICDINKLIKGTGWQIKGGTKHNPGYRLLKQEEK